MFSAYKRFLAVLLALLMLLTASLSLYSCEKGGEGSADGGDGASDATENSGDSATDAPVILGDFKITEEVRVVFPDRADDQVKDACKLIAQAIVDTYGINVKVSSDWNAAKGSEILVGKCGYRDSSIAFNEGIYAQGYGYSVLSETEIAISARSSENVYRAAKLFVEEVIQKTAEPKFAIGMTDLRNNKKPAAEYSINGIKLGDYTIVADKADNEAAVYLAETIKENLYTELKIVTADSFGGGHAIKIGNFGCNSYAGIRYRVGSETVNGVSTVYLDGQTEALCEKAAEFLYEKYLETKFEKADFKVPETIYSYKWPSSVSGQKQSGLYFNKLVEQKELAEGVGYYEMKYFNQDGKNVDAFVIVVEGSSKAEFRVWAGDMASIYDGKDQMTLKTVGAQATDLEKKTGDDVLGAINAGYFYIDTNDYPYSMRLIQGKELAPPSTLKLHNWPDDWVGLTKDGKLVHGNKATYDSTWKGKLEYAVATGVHIMLDGKLNVSNGVIGTTAINEDGNPGTHPLSVIALTKDGGFVLACADGRPWLRGGKSAGVTGVDMLGILLGLEAYYPDIEFVDVFTLDGGGSTEMVIERTAGSASFVTQNDPSDGKSRQVGDIIAVVIPK